MLESITVFHIREVTVNQLAGF